MSVLQLRRPLRAATQAQQEAGTSGASAVTSATQQYHPSAAKCWAYVTISGGALTLAASYNITSLTDVGVGDMTIVIANDFSSAAWSAAFAIEFAGVTGGRVFNIIAHAAGSVEVAAVTAASAAVDPTAWNFVGFGDQ